MINYSATIKSLIPDQMVLVKIPGLRKISDFNFFDKLQVGTDVVKILESEIQYLLDMYDKGGFFLIGADEMQPGFIPGQTLVNSFSMSFYGDSAFKVMSGFNRTVQYVEVATGKEIPAEHFPAEYRQCFENFAEILRQQSMFIISKETTMSAA